MKKIEIVVPRASVDRVRQYLEELGARGYTVLDVQEGLGPRGRTQELGWDNVANAYIFSVCKKDRVAPIMEALRPLLKRHGGVAFVTAIEDVIP